MWSSVTRVAFIAYVSVGVVAGTVPAYDYDPRTPKNCNYWYDNDGAYPCMAMPSVAKITREQYLEWVSDFLHVDPVAWIALLLENDI